MLLNSSWHFVFVFISQDLTAIVIQISYTVRILIFWLVDLCHVTLSYDETTALTSLSWCNSRGVNSIHHCPYTMTSGDSKFDDLSEADIDPLIDHSFGVHLTTKFMYFLIYFVKSMIHLLLTLKRITFKISILSVPSI